MELLVPKEWSCGGTTATRAVPDIVRLKSSSKTMRSVAFVKPCWLQSHQRSETSYAIKVLRLPLICNLVQHMNDVGDR
jgi:hypothetical protein